MNRLTNYFTGLNFMDSCRQVKDVILKSELSKKIVKAALPVFTIAGCVTFREDLAALIGRAFGVFYGYEGWVMPTLMVSSYLALKYFSSLNQDPDDWTFSNITQITTWLKEIPKNFTIGVSKFPRMLVLSSSVVIVTSFILKSFSINPYMDMDMDYATKMSEASMFRVVIQGPFLEELFFREFVQGSAISTMKLINLAALQMNKDLMIKKESIYNSSRIFSAAIFGLVHANQSLVQATTAGVTSYFYETLLYEKNGFFASFGLHCANNFFVWSLFEMVSGKSLKIYN